jgi:type I site-specific restriction endonuclease
MQLGKAGTFSADRNALVTQAKKTFKIHLPIYRPSI